MAPFFLWDSTSELQIEVFSLSIITSGGISFWTGGRVKSIEYPYSIMFKIQGSSVKACQALEKRERRPPTIELSTEETGGRKFDTYLLLLEAPVNCCPPDLLRLDECCLLKFQLPLDLKLAPEPELDPPLRK